MANVQIRQAFLDDTQAISRLFRSRISIWQRINTQGQVEDLPYEALTVYERWLHGSRSDSAWMSVETGAILLSHVLRGAGLAFVATNDNQVMAYAEAYAGSEPEPFGDHLHIAHLVADPAYANSGVDALLRHLYEHAHNMMDCRRITVSCAGYDAESVSFYQQHGFKLLSRLQRFTLPARTGQSFYKATEHLKTEFSQIKGWHMSLGRTESARQHWEFLWTRLWDAVPEIRDRKTQRLHFSAAGQDVFLCCQQQLYVPRSAEIWCWSPKPLTSQLLVAIRDWAHREGYRTLSLIVSDEAVKVLGTEAEAEPYYQEIYGLEV